MKIPNIGSSVREALLSLARIVSEDSQLVFPPKRPDCKSSKDS